MTTPTTAAPSPKRARPRKKAAPAPGQDTPDAALDPAERSRRRRVQLALAAEGLRELALARTTTPHALLCDLLVPWCLQAFSAHVVYVEPPLQDGTWIPDVLAITPPAAEVWRFEVKVSRADFLRDQAKANHGHPVGLRRFYVAPAGLVEPAELPPGWGLVEWSPPAGRHAPHRGLRVAHDPELAHWTAPELAPLLYQAEVAHGLERHREQQARARRDRFTWPTPEELAAETAEVARHLRQWSSFRPPDTDGFTRGGSWHGLAAAWQAGDRQPATWQALRRLLPHRESWAAPWLYQPPFEVGGGVERRTLLDLLRRHHRRLPFDGRGRWLDYQAAHRDRDLLPSAGGGWQPVADACARFFPGQPCLVDLAAGLADDRARRPRLLRPPAHVADEPDLETWAELLPHHDLRRVEAVVIEARTVPNPHPDHRQAHNTKIAVVVAVAVTGPAAGELPLLVQVHHRAVLTAPMTAKAQPLPDTAPATDTAED